MERKFTVEELNFLLQSAIYSKKKFEEYEYESTEQRNEQIRKAEEIIAKIRTILKIE